MNNFNGAGVCLSTAALAFFAIITMMGMSLWYGLCVVPFFFTGLIMVWDRE